MIGGGVIVGVVLRGVLSDNSHLPRVTTAGLVSLLS